MYGYGARREADYAREGMQEFMDTVYQQMRLATGVSVCVQMLNYLLAFSVAALSVWLWMQSAISIGAIAIAISLALRLNGMSQWIMWEVSMLFENIGTVLDGITTLSRPQEVQDQPDAPSLHPQRGEVRFERLFRDLGRFFQSRLDVWGFADSRGGDHRCNDRIRCVRMF